MTVPTAAVAVSPAVSGQPAAMPAAEGATPVPADTFASLLPASGGATPGAAIAVTVDPATGQKNGETNDSETEEKTDDESDLTLAQQTSLAALLYTRPASLPPPPSAPPASLGESIPGNTAEIPQWDTPSTPMNFASPSRPRASGELAPETPVFQVTPTPAKSASLPQALNRLPVVLPDPAVETAPTSAALPNAGESIPPAAAVLPESGAAPAPTLAAPSLAPNSQPNEGQNPRPIEAAEIAALPRPVKTAPEITPAISASAAPAPVAAEASALISASPANADVSLTPEQSAPSKSSRGTGGAKPVRDMIDTSATHPNSAPDTRHARSAAAGFGTATAGIDKESPKGSPRDAQDLAPATRSEANRPMPDSFSLATPSPASPNARSEANAPIVESRPMSSAAIVAELGHGLEQIQQRGHDRVDLRLSLEGGGEVSIQLQVRDGAVHASFHTASTELREALQQGWSQMAGRAENQGLPLAPPVFKTPNTAFGSAGQQDSRERRQEPPQNQSTRSTASYSAPHQPRRAAHPAPPARTHTTSGLSTWA